MASQKKLTSQITKNQETPNRDIYLKKSSILKKEIPEIVLLYFHWFRRQCINTGQASRNIVFTRAQFVNMMNIAIETLRSSECSNLIILRTFYQWPKFLISLQKNRVFKISLQVAVEFPTEGIINIQSGT